MDEFNQDPQVRLLREVFQAIEAWEQDRARSLGLDWTDGRVGLVRQAALERFLPDFHRAALSGPEGAVEIYARAYDRALAEILPGETGGAGEDGGDA